MSERGREWLQSYNDVVVESIGSYVEVEWREPEILICVELNGTNLGSNGLNLYS